MVLVTAWLYLHLAESNRRPYTSHSTLATPHSIEYNVALVETGGSHDEVTAALYYALTAIPGVYTSMYLALPRFGIENIYAWIHRRYKLSPYTISQPYEFTATNDTMLPGLIVLASCEHDVFAVDTTLDYYFSHGPKDQKVLCVMHHIDRFKAVEERLRRWARAGRLHFLTLSQHTTSALRTQLDTFKEPVYTRVPIHTFPPVFPAPLDPSPAQDNRISFAIQGNFEESRRQYLKTLLDFERMLDELPPSLRERMHLILAGHGTEIGIPGKILPYVSVNFSLDFIPYYNLLHSSFALIPAFADHTYYDVKASSSIPASFIADTPVLGGRRLAESYSYLSRECMWFTSAYAGDAGDDVEDEMTSVYEILREHFDDSGMEKASWRKVVEQKKSDVRKRATILMQHNVRLMQDIIVRQSK